MFNLVTSPWLPVRDHAGRAQPISLFDAFQSPDQWADLDLRPHERVAVMRLLICIAQAALGAPEDAEGWEEFGSDFSERTTSYLRRWQPAFELLGDGPRFLQRRPAKEVELTKASKLVPHLASGNNPCNFDHGGGTARPMEPATLALALLTFQNFYPLYGAGFKGRGPCVDGNMLHTFRRGANGRELILGNCLPRDFIETPPLGGMGRPLWEQPPKSLTDRPAVDNARLTYLGRLVPLHRTVWIHDDRAHLLVGQEGWVYPAFEEYQEPSATVITTAKGEERQLWASLDKAIWRDLHALTVLNRPANSNAGAPLLVQAHQSAKATQPADIWTGALVTDGKAKILDTVESVFHLDARLFTDDGRGIYKRGVDYAWTRSLHLRNAVRDYGKAMKHESPPVTLAEHHYWHSLDRQSPRLLAVACDPAVGDLHFGGASRDDWSGVVRAALRAAYERACPRDTPRQIEAFALGLRALYPPPPRPKTRKTPQAA